MESAFLGICIETAEPNVSASCSSGHCPHWQRQGKGTEDIISKLIVPQKSNKRRAQHMAVKFPLWPLLFILLSFQENSISEVVKRSREMEAKTGRVNFSCWWWRDWMMSHTFRTPRGWRNGDELPIAKWSAKPRQYGPQRLPMAA